MEPTAQSSNGSADKKTKKIVVFKRIEIVRTPVALAAREGAPPLLMNKMPTNVLEVLGGKATGEVVARAEKTGAQETAEQHIHRVDGAVAFPAAGFEKAIIDACRHQKISKNLSMARVNGAFSVTGEAFDYCLIESDPWTVHAAVVNTSGKKGPPSMSFRPAFSNWKTKIFLDYNPQSVTIDELMHLLDLAGFHCGVGSHRPRHGKFSLV